MNKQFIQKIIKAITVGMAGMILLPVLGGCKKEPVNTVTLELPKNQEIISASEAAPEKEPQELIEEIVVLYGQYGDKADSTIDGLLKDLAGKDAESAARWEEIINVWRGVNDTEIHYDVLPDDLKASDELCIVVLGFQLNPDGSMKEELIERLTVAKKSAEKYPDAYIICTGGGTASENADATEAGKMAEWLINQGIPKERVLVEDHSLTTAQNAQFSFDLIYENCPQVRQIVIVSSDYHIATGTLLFEAESVLRGSEAKVVSNAAYEAPTGYLSPMFQAGALIELSGDVKTAYEIYYNTYDIHELPDLEQ